MPDKNIHDISQSDISLNENPTGNTFNNEAAIVQGLVGDDDKIKLWKIWTMEMPTNDGNISMTMTSGLKQANGDYKIFLYARATHSIHSIQYTANEICPK